MITTVNRPPENASFVLDNNQGWVALIDRMGEEIKTVNAARVSFGKMKTEFDEKDATLLNFLINEKHFAPLEHITLTFLVHCPLFVRGQWHRHRTWSYNEVSRRYTEIDMELYTPEFYRNQSKDNKQASIDNDIIENNEEAKAIMSNANKSALDTYNKLLEFICYVGFDDEEKYKHNANITTRFSPPGRTIQDIKYHWSGWFRHHLSCPAEWFGKKGSHQGVLYEGPV